jgi:hypothetical protein
MAEMAARASLITRSRRDGGRVLVKVFLLNRTGVSLLAILKEVGIGRFDSHACRFLHLSI